MEQAGTTQSQKPSVSAGFIDYLREQGKNKWCPEEDLPHIGLKYCNKTDLITVAVTIVLYKCNSFSKADVM